MKTERERERKTEMNNNEEIHRINDYINFSSYPRISQNTYTGDYM